jgi:hypothetical protein
VKGIREIIPLKVAGLYKPEIGKSMIGESSSLGK